ncbi:MAG: hypothetical protein RIS94_2357 [Pseudomonadota bacterium]|jgi:hypothetical protein
MKLIAKSAVAVGLTAAALASAAPAEARDRWHRGGDDTAAWAIGAGIVGLAIGAAIASDHDDRDYDGYYSRGYYPRYRGGYYYSYPSYPAYPVYRGYDSRYRNDEWRQHERWEHRGDGYRGGYGGGYRGGWGHRGW